MLKHICKETGQSRYSTAKLRHTNKNLNISFVGAGNIAHHLAKNFYQHDVVIDCILSRNIKNARALAAQTKSQSTDQWSELWPDSHVYFICVNDDNIQMVTQALSDRLPAEAIVLHTSGNTSLNVLSIHFENSGVFYPLQSFRRESPVDFKEVPVLVTATNNYTSEAVIRLAGLLTENVVELSDDKRMRLHLPAVLVNNFVNYLYSTAYDFCLKKELPFEVLLPLLRRTAMMVNSEEDPWIFQTGPAVRQDEKTMEKHIEQLAQYPDYQELYMLLSKLIKERSHENHS